jgi:two-component system OmpR family sensor kinase
VNNRRFRWGIREKLTLLFFGVTLIAVTVNFLMVVPRLELRLRNDRTKAMKQTADRFSKGFSELATSYDPSLNFNPAAGGAVSGATVWNPPTESIASSTGNRVAVLKTAPRVSPLGPEQFTVFVDPSGETKVGEQVVDPVAARAIQSKRVASGLVDFNSGLHAQAASPILVNGQAVGAVVYSTSLSGVNTIVKQQARRNLVAAIFALSISLMAGLIASSYIARRIRRLEKAAREVTKGNFTEPLPVDSRDEIGELARAFNTMQERLGRADRARKAFIANASHELRTPLFSLGGYVELMREEDLDEATQREFLDTMHHQITRMTKLATDLLDLSKLDTGSLQIQPERVDMGELAHGIAREFEPLAAEHDSELTVITLDGVDAICDPDRIAQIVRILVDNALSHTPAGTAINLVVEDQAGGVDISVSDNGPGISDEDLPRIFDRFHTGDKTGGTGLGLSIANELAEAMDSQLDVDSSPEGTTFTLHLQSEVRGKQKGQPAPA